MPETLALIVGNDARAHAFAQSVSPDVDRVYMAGGKDWAARVSNGVNLPYGANDTDEILSFVDARQPALTVISPEQPLVEGLGDRLRATGKTAVFGPNADGAQLEGSKIYSGRFMAEFGIPHPDFVEAYGYYIDGALQALGSDARTKVVKADGLAAGKGVDVEDDLETAQQLLKGMLSGERFGDAGRSAIIQEREIGPEISITVVTDGTRWTSLASSQDHKRLLAGDKGPNTGGMGAYAPASFLLDKATASITDEAIDATLGGLRSRGIDYRGVLYAGLMLTADGPKFLEYNVRLGDPEAQVVLPRLRDQGENPFNVFYSAAQGHLEVEKERTVSSYVDGDAADPGDVYMTYALASENYPGTPVVGREITGLDRQYQDVTVQIAGAKRKGGRVETSGGRVLTVTGRGPTAQKAAEAARAAIDQINFDGQQSRDDIGSQLIEHEAAA